MLLIQSYENLRDEHAALKRRVADAEDGSAAHAARLAADLAAAQVGAARPPRHTALPPAILPSLAIALLCHSRHAFPPPLPSHAA